MFQVLAVVLLSLCFADKAVSGLFLAGTVFSFGKVGCSCSDWLRMASFDCPGLDSFACSGLAVTTLACLRFLFFLFFLFVL